MLEKSKRERQKAVDNWVLIRKTAIKTYMSRYKKRVVGMCVLAGFGVIASTFIVPNINIEQFISFKKITPKNLNRLSEDAFRKIIGYGYEEKIYIKDTAEIRSRLESSNMIFGNIRFTVGLIPYELEIEFKEASPLFVLMPQRPDTVQLIYSDKGEIYPYSANAADLPAVEAKSAVEISLATNFLVNMREHDILLYSRISQLIPSEARRQIAVFFNDVDFKTRFSLESDYWQTAFRYYRQLTRNMRILDMSSVAVLDLRFKQLAYTLDKERRL